MQCIHGDLKRCAQQQGHNYRLCRLKAAVAVLHECPVCFIMLVSWRPGCGRVYVSVNSHHSAPSLTLSPCVLLLLPVCFADHMAIELTDQVTVTLPSGQRMCSFRLWSNPHALAAIGPKYDNYMAGLTGLKVFLGGMPEAIDLIGPRYHVSPLSYQCQEQYQEARQDAEGRYLSAFRSFMSDLPGLGHLLSQRGLSEGGVDFLMWLLEPQPCDRPSAQLALQHKWLAPAVQQLQQEVQGSQQ